MSFLLHQRRKEPQEILNGSCKQASFAILCRDGVADLQGFEKILLDLHDRLAVIHPKSALKVHIKASEIEVCRADRGGGIVGNEGLAWMNPFVYS